MASWHSVLTWRTGHRCVHCAQYSVRVPSYVRSDCVVFMGVKVVTHAHNPNPGQGAAAGKMPSSVCKFKTSLHYIAAPYLKNTKWASKMLSG